MPGDVDRARLDGDEGLLKVVVKKGTDRILGATLVARNVPDQGLRIRDTGDGFVTLSVTLQHPRRRDGKSPLTRTFGTRVPLR